MIKEFELVANKHFEVSRLIHDRHIKGFIKASQVRHQCQYIPEYLGILETFDKLFFSSNIKDIEYPASFYDHFKLKFFPNWLLRLSPAKKKHFNISAVMPRLEYNLDEINVLQRDVANIPEEDKIIIITQSEKDTW